MRTHFATGNFIGEGEDATFQILSNMTGLPERQHDEFPKIGIYRQLPVSIIYDEEQMRNLADFHKKSSIDIFIVRCEDEFMPKFCRLAVRVEGKKGDLKMLRQGVQRWLLEKWCQVVDVHKRECKELFKDRVNEKSIKELEDVFKTAKVEILRIEN